MKNWKIHKIEDVLDYIQPTKYIVKDTQYNDSFDTPVLTPGKSFLLGYTNEKEGVFEDVPTIIFDDFTTAFKYVDFPFKVKSSAMKMLKVKSKEYDIKFLYYLMLSLNFEADEHKRHWISIYSQQLVPLPPLGQQKKIASILDAADAYRQKTKALISKYDELTQSLFLDMFGDPVKNEKGWEKVATIKYCDSIVPGRDKPKSFTGETPWITTADLKHLGKSRKSRTNLGLNSDEITEVRAKIIPKGSVIMTCVGDLGVVSINENDIVMNQQLHAFICHQKLNNMFLMYNLSYQKPYMYKMASSTTVPYMNKTVANNTPTIVPPIELQNQFAERVQAIEQQKAQAQESLEKAEELFNSLLQKAFKGELVEP
jgi:type I restriction enzyme S subunit